MTTMQNNSATAQMPGPVMVDVQGTQLSSAERTRLQHPLVGGVILFARNFESRQQLTQLCADIHTVRNEPLLIAVDHEGVGYNVSEQMVLRHCPQCASWVCCGSATLLKQAVWLQIPAMSWLPNFVPAE
ncbi:hypothetical protein L1889_08665 [Paenalcaligenes niemegkensis]|nr:glycoside hydrolase family 3 N-terminal domain-containing protein [Paenalcaligenes niemegkensis]MCQ9616771.1 hypothetical protein [Paenalcaligenes niemegkensis]